MIANQNDPRANHIAAMDLRHRNWIESVLLSGRFDRVLEIGSFEGYSTVAFFNALRVGAVKEVHLCDLKPRPALLDAIRQEQSPHIHLHQCLSTQLLAEDGEWDLIVVDGDHSKDNCLNELPLLLNVTPDVIFIHDTCSYLHYPNCEGSAFLKRAFQLADYYCTEDNLPREGERTHRGLFAAAFSDSMHQIVLDGYRQHC